MNMYLVKIFIFTRTGTQIDYWLIKSSNFEGVYEHFDTYPPTSFDWKVDSIREVYPGTQDAKQFYITTKWM